MAFVPIQNRDRARQLISFKGMELGARIWPTDFDALIEWKNRAWILFEVKHGGKAVPTGQRLALERFVGDMWRSGKPSVAAVVEHWVSDPSQDVILADCMVREVYVGGEGRWRPTKTPIDARTLVSSYLDYTRIA